MQKGNSSFRVYFWDSPSPKKLKWIVPCKKIPKKYEFTEN